MKSAAVFANIGMNIYETVENYRCNLPYLSVADHSD